MGSELIVENPLILVYASSGQIVFRLCPCPTDSPASYGILIANLARHAAQAFKVQEDDIWGWVEQERFHPTTKIYQPN